MIRDKSKRTRRINKTLSISMIKILEQIHEVRPWKKHTQRYEKGVSKILNFRLGRRTYIRKISSN